MPGKERRKEVRMGLGLPVRVQGHEASGLAWAEMTTSEDTSAGGAAFAMRRHLTKNQVVLLSLPLPKRFRSYSLSEPSYRVYAMVRSVEPLPRGCRVGVMFLGKSPPRGYAENPGSRYLLPSDPAPGREERRQVRRFDIFLNMKLVRLDVSDGERREERTVAENLGKGGARLMTSLPIFKGETVHVEEIGGDFRTRAEVRHVYIGKDNVPRLNLRFLDGEAPERLIPVD